MQPPLIRRTFLAALTTALGLAALAQTAAAQQPVTDDDRWHPQWGDWSLAFHLPEGGGAGVGFWKQRGRNMALGLVVEGSLDAVSTAVPGQESLQTTSLRLALGPGLRRYWWQQGPVSPFFHTGLAGFYQQAEAPGTATWLMGGELSLGIGAEWYPAEGIGIGGHTGVTGGFSWTTDDDDLTGDRTALFVDLFTSALSVQLYF